MLRRGRVSFGFAIAGVAFAAGAGQASAAIVGQPSVADRGARSTVAWTQSPGGPEGTGALEIADQTADGDFAGATTLGAASQAPRLAAAADGTQALVWQDGGTLYAATRRAGASAWSSRTTLAQVGAGSSEPALAFGPDDRLVVLWVVRPSDSAMGPVLAATRTAAGAWQPAQVLAADAVDPDVAVDSAGDVAAVFRADAVYEAMLPVGAADWTPAQRIPGQAGFANGAPQIAGGGARTFVASWSAQGAGLLAARVRAPGALEPAAILDPRVASWNVTQPSLLVDGNGGTLAVWPYATFRIEGSIGAATLPALASSWDPAADLQDIDLRPDWYIHPNATRLGVDSSGDVTLAFSVWHALAEDVDMFALTAPSVRGPWTGGTTRIGTSACVQECPESRAPELAVSPSGAATVAYDAGDGTIAAIHRASPGDAWSAPQLLQSYTFAPTFHVASSRVSHGALSLRVLVQPSARLSIVARRPTRSRTLAGKAQRLVGGAVPSMLVRVPLIASIRKLILRSGRLKLHLAATFTDAYGNVLHAGLSAIVRR